jgi:glycosyltransferase involved in cell wall biosynthesis
MKYQISIIAPLYNEEGNLVPLFEGIQEVFQSSGKSFELIYVNDGSVDQSGELLEKLAAKHSNVTVVELYKNKGKASAIEVGMQLVQGEFISVVDCDLQYDPNDILKLVAELEKGADVVSGCRILREDSRMIVYTSKLFNWLMKIVTRLDFKDYFSGLKCYRRSVIRYLSLYGDLYRFASVFAFKQGFKVVEVPVVHLKRTSGASRYNFFSRLRMAFVDLLTTFLTIVFNQDRIYYLEIFATFLLSLGLLVVFVSEILFSYGAGEILAMIKLIGFSACFFAFQLFLFCRITNNFYLRHEEERDRRRRNVRFVLRDGASFENIPV